MADLSAIANLVAIGKFVLELIMGMAVVILILIGKDPKLASRLGVLTVLIIIVSGLSLAVPGWIVYLLAIVIATSSPGTATDLVVRSAGWASILGIAWGIFWGFVILPRLINLIERQE
jgi:hypothetical protein